MKQLMQKAEDYYMQDNEREMHIVTDELYFVISEQQHSVDMTDKGHDLLANAVSNPDFFVLPDVGSQIAGSEEHGTLRRGEAGEEGCPYGGLLPEERACPHRHPAPQGLRYVQKDVDYIVIDNKGRDCG